MICYINFFENNKLLLEFLEIIKQIRTPREQNTCKQHLAQYLVYHPAALSSIVSKNWNLPIHMHTLSKKKFTKEQINNPLIDLLRRALVLGKKRIFGETSRKDFVNNFANTYLAFRLVSGFKVKKQILPHDCAKHIMGYTRYFCNETPKDQRVIDKLYATTQAKKTRTKGEENFYDKTGESKQKRRKI